MLAIPELIPVTTPVVATTVAVPVAPLVQLPPVGPLLSVVVLFSHTCSVPVMASGNGFTVTVAIFEQPVPNEYDIVTVASAVEPVTTPYTTPVVLTVAIAVLLLAHVPPPVRVLRFVVCPWHTCITPVMLAGSEYTVTVSVTLHCVTGSV